MGVNGEECKWIHSSPVVKRIKTSTYFKLNTKYYSYLWVNVQRGLKLSGATLISKSFLKNNGNNQWRSSTRCLAHVSASSPSVHVWCFANAPLWLKWCLGGNTNPPVRKYLEVHILLYQHHPGNKRHNKTVISSSGEPQISKYEAALQRWATVWLLLTYFQH